MNFRTKQLLERLTDEISSWPAVECVILNEAAIPDNLDPYFAIILDVFYSGDIPSEADRAALYCRDLSAFETSGAKDRFMVEYIPVRVEFKPTARIEEYINIATGNLDSLFLIKDSGTYGFYRLTHGAVLFDHAGWILSVRKRLTRLPERFWQEETSAWQSRMEHYLNDLGAALIQNDNFFFLVSASGFIKTACLTLFCLNKCFEPSHRLYYKQVLSLPVLPASFAAQIENFLNSSSEITMDRKYSIAQLIGKGVSALTASA
jgi:hypothetical protein